MAGYRNLIRTLEKLRVNVASFRKVVLHAHSPDSYDYGFRKRTGEKRDSGIGDKADAKVLFADEVKKIDVDMLAITDHMKCGFACDLSASATSEHPTILPGMEINFRPAPPWNTFRLHVLAIFPESYSLEKVCKFLPATLPGEEERSGREEISGIELAGFVGQICACGGLCVAAHIDTDRGIRRAFRQLGRDGIVFYDPEGELTEEEERQISEVFKDWMLSAGFDAIEVAQDKDKVHYRWISDIRGQPVSIPVLLKNDAHWVKDLAEENRYTYVKMTSVCFEGLKQALQFPDTRVRFPSDLPAPPSPRILGIEIIAGDTKGFFKELQIPLSDNLTCLIGPRGSGKSAIIEALRYVFGYNRTLDQIEHPGTDLANKVRGLQEATLTNCVIRIVYYGDDGQPHILEATYDPKQDYVTRVYTVDGEEREVHDVEASGLYPMRLFGWSEIETLGREVHRQRELLDRLIPGIFQKLERRNELRIELAEKRMKIMSLVSNFQTIMNKNQGEIKRYKEYKADFDELNTPEVKDLFTNLDTAKGKEAVLDRLRNDAQDWLDKLVEIADTDLFEGVDELLTGATKTVNKWWVLKKSEMKLVEKQSDVVNEISKTVNRLTDLIREIDVIIQEVTVEIQENDKAIRDMVSEEAAKQIAAELRRTAEARLQRVKNMRRDYDNQWKLLNDSLADWGETTDNLKDIHDEISGKRATRKEEIETRLNQFGTVQMAVSLRFGAGHDRRKFETHLRDSGFLSRNLHGNYKAHQWPEKIASVCTPVELAKAILDKEPDTLIKAITFPDRGTFEVDESIAHRLIDTLYPFGYDDDADLPIVDDQELSKVLTVAEVEWDDVEGILLNERPVEHLSPGQRSSAMLPLIALAERAPLVIDQPEDNLDNRLVGKMLVDILADLKEKRQIMVATHNPNIVVSGDAEQVIVLDALSVSEGTCTRSGSIDNQEIIDSVIDIMEGGKEAFLARLRRYSLD